MHTAYSQAWLNPASLRPSLFAENLTCKTHAKKHLVFFYIHFVGNYSMQWACSLIRKCNCTVATLCDPVFDIQLGMTIEVRGVQFSVRYRQNKKGT